MIKMCLECKNPFKTRDHRQKFCNMDCYKKNHNIGVKIKKVCRFCGKIFFEDKHHKKIIYCSVSCARKQDWKREDYRKIKIEQGRICGKKGLGKIRVVRITKVCPICNKQFSHVPNYARQVECCSYKCAGMFRAVNMTPQAREIRKIIRSRMIYPKQDTSIEVKIQDFLSLLHVEYFTHKYMSEITHAYQCDILIPSTKTIIECDGDYWHGNPIKFPEPSEKQKQQIEKDRFRTKELQEKGYRVIRLWEREIIPMSLEEFNQIIN